MQRITGGLLVTLTLSLLMVPARSSSGRAK